MGMHEREGHALPTAQHPLVLTKAERIVLWLFHGQLPGLLTKVYKSLSVSLIAVPAFGLQILRNAAVTARCIAGPGSQLFL